MSSISLFTQVEAIGDTKVAFELNIGALFGNSHYYPKMIPIQSTFGTLIRGLSIQSVRLVVVLPSKLIASNFKFLVQKYYYDNVLCSLPLKVL